jgi:hypothetical protein
MLSLDQLLSRTDPGSPGTWLAALLAWPVAYVLLGSARDKLANGVVSFELAIEAYRLMPKGLSPAVARSLLLGEVITGLLLLVPSQLGRASWAVIALSALFLAAQLSAIARKLHIDCGCRGSESQIVSYKTALLPLSLLVGGLCLQFVWHAFAAKIGPEFYIIGPFSLAACVILRGSIVPLLWIRAS